MIRFFVSLLINFIKSFILVQSIVTLTSFDLITMSQENQNQPALPTERNQPRNFVNNFYKQPNIGSEQPPLRQNTTQSPYPPSYECNLCSKKFNRYGDLTNHNKIHSFFNFACWICKRNFLMSKSNMLSHFKDHEQSILLRTGYTRLLENQLYSFFLFFIFTIHYRIASAA